MARILRGLYAVLLAGVSVFCAAFALALNRAPLFSEGSGYELYLGPSSSSLVLISENPALDKLLHRTAGESVRYDGDCAESLIERFHAALLFTEEADGVKNYYLFSPCLKEEILLYGERVNLHIAVGRGQTAVGTPLIFGGF